MKLEDWLKENRWSVRGFSKHTDISMTALNRALKKNDGGITLKTARLIERETEGKVKIKDLLPDDEELTKVKRPTKQKKKNEEQIDNVEQSKIE